ncbi:MAG: preprotein translocase subunit SecY [Tissierellia bacterium]|nr:preprotein translocase subunit SecY [Tissierellia bacterium]
MLSTLKDAWGIKEIRKKMVFTLMMLLVYRLGASIPVPFMDKRAIAMFFEGSSGSILDFLDMMSGGAFSSYSIFAANIYPYITASIVMQLLTYAFPALERLSKEGEAGRKKIQQYTKYLGVALAAVTAIGYTFGVFRTALQSTNMLQNVIIILSIVGGSQFLVWLGEQITKRGIGNGISLIIFLGIVARMPADITRMISMAKAGDLSWIAIILFAIFAFFVILFVVLLNEGERRIPVQYAKRVVGRKMYGGQNTHIPIKVSMAGVMPVIFANSILAIPSTIVLIKGKNAGAFTNFIHRWFTTDFAQGIVIITILNIALIMFFTYFYTSLQFNTVEYSKNLQQNGGFVPGIRPGRSTSDYLSKVVNRLVFVGGIGLAILATLPTFLSIFGKIPMKFGGTSLIIVVGVVLETLRSIEQQMLIRHYSGFLK